MVAPAIIALGGSLLYGDHDVKTWLGQLRQTIVHFEGNAVSYTHLTLPTNQCV